MVALMRKCWAPAPAERYQSFTEITAELKRVLKEVNEGCGKVHGALGGESDGQLADAPRADGFTVGRLAPTENPMVAQVAEAPTQNPMVEHASPADGSVAPPPLVSKAPRLQALASTAASVAEV